MKKNFSQLSTWLLALVFVVVIFFVTVYPRSTKYAISDFLQTRNYQLSAPAQELANDIQLTKDANYTYRATRPQVRDKQDFNDVCPATSESSVLGCYSRDRIFILKVDDEQLDGVEQVTTAHEILHAEWARLEQRQRDELSELLQAEYEANNQDGRLTDLVESYRQGTEGDDADLIANELHSILPTEIRSMSEQLEDYYSQYFADRQILVDFFEQYETEFEIRKDRISEITTLRDALAVEIKQLNAEIDTLAVENEQIVNEINQLREAGQIQQSNQLVPLQNQLVVEIRETVSSVNQKIARYNELVKENNQLAVELNDLASSLDATEVDL